MSANKFQQLIETLNTELIILIDDDFTPVTNVGDTIGYLCSLDHIDFELFRVRLNLIAAELAEPIVNLVNKIQILDPTEEERQYLDAGLIVQMLDQRGEGQTKGEAEALIDVIEKSERKDDYFNLVMMYGLRQSAGTEKYKGFFDAASMCEKPKSIRLYKGLEGEEFASFEQEILAVNKEKSNKFPLLIVDRYLANHQNGNEIIESLRNNPNGINHFFSVLYTSQGEETLENYFHIQLRKDDEKAIEKVAEALALSAFATFFGQIHKHRSKALEEAKSLILESGVQNMVYLAGMANDEGETVFNVFKNWFDLLTDKKVQEELLKVDPDGFDLSFMANLTNLINSDFISVIVGNTDDGSQFHTELKQLSTFEIFDEQVNQFCSPPAVGDIYDINGQLYLLAGQECDLVVRTNGGGVKRNERLAELIKCDFVAGAIDVKVDDSKVDSVPINHFIFNGDKGVLRLNLNQKDFFDFRLLDLCCTNVEGEANLTSLPLAEEITNLLPTKWQDYLPTLFKEIGEKIKVQTFLNTEGIDPNSLTGDMSLNIPFEELEGASGFKFPIKRIGRIKGQFREYTMQRYWQYKTRQGLNTIGVYQRRQTKIETIQIGFSHNLTSIAGDHFAWLQLTSDRQKNQKKSTLELVLMKDHILDLVHEDHKHLINSIDKKEIVIPTKGDFEQNKVIISKNWEKDKLSVEVVLPIHNEFSDWLIKVERKMSLTHLFGKEFLNEHESIKKAVYVTDEESTPFRGEKEKWVTLEELSNCEIHLPDENLILKFNPERGVISTVGQIKHEEEE